VPRQRPRPRNEPGRDCRDRRVRPGHHPPRTHRGPQPPRNGGHGGTPALTGAPRAAAAGYRTALALHRACASPPQGRPNRPARPETLPYAAVATNPINPVRAHILRVIGATHLGGCQDHDCHRKTGVLAAGSAGRTGNGGTIKWAALQAPCSRNARRRDGCVETAVSCQKNDTTIVHLSCRHCWPQSRSYLPFCMRSWPDHRMYSQTPLQELRKAACLHRRLLARSRA